jgi:hypothetical protein
LVRRETPLRKFGTPDEIAEAALFLASDQSDFVTGEVLTVSGGRAMRRVSKKILVAGDSFVSIEDFSAEHCVFCWFSVQFGVMKAWRLVPVDAPWSPS